jgi:hypothetical protein
VEKLVCIHHIQISVDGRYLVDLHVQVGVGGGMICSWTELN